MHVFMLHWWPHMMHSLQHDCILCRYGEAGLKNGMGGMGGADMGGFNNPFDLFEQVMRV